MAPTDPDRRSRLDVCLYSLAWALFLLAQYRLYIHLSLYFSRPQHPLWYFFSSDSFVFDSLYEDLFRDGFHWSGWHISHSPQLLEMLWYFALRLLSGDVVRAHVLNAMLLPALLAVGFQLLLRSLHPRAPLRQLAVMVLSAGAIILLFVRGQELDMTTFFWVARHFSSIVADFACLALLLRLLDEPRPGLLALLMACAAAGAAADQIVLVEFTLPMLTALLALAWRKHLSGARLGLLVGSLLGSIPLGIGLFMVVSPRSTLEETVTPQPQLVVASLARVTHDLVLPRDPVQRCASLLLALLCGAALVRAVVVSRALGRGEAGPDALRSLAFSIYAPLMVIAVMGAMVALGRPVNTVGYTRQLDFVETLGVFGLGLVLARALPWARSALLPVTAACAFLALMAEGWAGLQPSTTSVFKYYPPLTACLDGLADENKIQYGVADYWLARYNTVFSRRGLRIYAVKPGVVPHTHSNNIEWFLGGVGAKRYDQPRYSFVILGQMIPNRGGLQSPGIVKRFGEPLKVTECSGWSVLVYDPGKLDPEVKERFRENTEVRQYYERHGYTLP